MTRHILMRLIESYFRHRWLYLLPIFIMIGAAGISFYITKPRYSSHAIVYVQKESLLASLTSFGVSNSSYWATPAQITSWEINELFQSDAFIRAIIQKTDIEKEMGGGQSADAKLIEDVRRYIWATPFGGDNQVQLNASYADPNTATQLVNGVIDVYVQWKLNASRVQSEAAQVFFKDLITNYQAELDVARQAMKTYINEHPLPIRGERPELEQMDMKSLEGDIDLATTRLSNALEKEENARLAQVQSESDARSTYVMIDAPQPPLKPEISRRQLALKYGVFIVVGFILSLTAIAGAALLDRSIRFPNDVTNSLILPVLAVVPDVNLLSQRTSKKPKAKKIFGRRLKKSEVEKVPSMETILDPQLDVITSSLTVVQGDNLPPQKTVRKSKSKKKIRMPHEESEVEGIRSTETILDPQLEVTFPEKPHQDAISEGDL